ncbi:MAG: 2,3-bisphosphoglycerate-independent phosphoglycerate mutase [Candidatus Omnitrophica bacterium]|nr:2,3-bisphosphoglycerate-independent phosphoglycerate mutase [Candidatus Omnitrophota bacterium]MBU4333613.1 2,3-bisphosphoglycerate-independent phosphoglycerate mutase [Candidatus Omnitrophota bacterium]
MLQTLKKCDKYQGCKGPLMLIIMDGVGIGKKDESDGVFVAKTPCLDALFESEYYTELQSHGTAVGMPSEEDMGNSEVGHNALGAGRVFNQGASLVNNCIKDRTIYEGETWKKLEDNINMSGGAFHFIGLLSDGNVHSHIDHLIDMIQRCSSEGIKKVRVHVLLDGRDVYERSALTYIEKVEELLAKINTEHGFDYKIASGGGRMITTMDRYNADWSVVKRGWDAHVLGKARMFGSASEAIQIYYDEDEKINDQFLEAFVIGLDGKPVGTIEDGDSVVFFNFRGDRAMELSLAFDEGDDFDKFDRERTPDVFFAGMMEYDGDLHVPKNYLVIPPQIDNSISEYLCYSNVKTFAISETQKFGHVTYFWNGNRSGYINEALETYIEIPSDKIKFEEAPKMKAEEIAEKTIELLKSGEFRFGRLNFANGDMVGHTGIEAAIITAVETVDACVKKVIDAVMELGGVVLVTADHGNADEMFTMKNGKKVVSTAHSLNKVPFVIIDSNFQGEYKMADLPKKGLSNVAATILNFLGYEKPENYDPSLIEFK